MAFQMADVAPFAPALGVCPVHTLVRYFGAFSGTTYRREITELERERRPGTRFERWKCRAGASWTKCGLKTCKRGLLPLLFYFSTEKIMRKRFQISSVKSQF